MQTKIKTNTAARRDGSVLVTSVVMLTLAGITVASVLTAALSYTRQTERAYDREKASFLADAGLRAALVKLNAYSEGNISYNQSRGYFASSNSMDAANWGFTTSVSLNTNGNNMVVSTGRYGSQSVDVQAEVSLGAGSRSIHALYAHALFAGDSDGDGSYVLQVGGTGSGADFVNGDTYSGNDIAVSGDAELRLPEELTVDADGDGIYDPSTDSYRNSYAATVFTNPLSQAAFDAYVASMAGHTSKLYSNGKYDFGEAFVDTIGNGRYDLGEPFTDLNGNGVRDPGDEFTDLNGNGVWDPGEPFVDFGNGVYDEGEEWTDDPNMPERQNGRYDGPDGYWEQQGSGYWEWYRCGWWWCRRWVETSDWVWVEVPGLAGEQFEDLGDGIFYAGEPYTDQNGVYDEGEMFFDDRNQLYDYGTQAPGTITGMPSPGPGQRSSTGGDPVIDPPDLVHMYYELDRNGTEPGDALVRWGHDVAVEASDYSSNGHVINNVSTPEHIFVRNVPRTPAGTGNDQFRETYGGVQVRSRGYDKVYDNSGQPVDDYFLEDPTDSTYNEISSYDVAQDDGNRTHRTLINVRPEDNVKLYYVDGNVWLHATPTWALGFREPGTRITIVANGNITISDEFYYNADYDSNLQYSDMDSTVVNNPSDALCLIALKRPNCDNSGNVYIGDPAMGTGGSIHAMLYAENDFIDNNLNTVDQQFISVYGNMSAGNHVALNRQTGGGHYRTRLDVTLDYRIRDGEIIVPGLPHPVGGQRAIQLDTAWHMVVGSWSSWSMLQ
jgi:hypothetical protein